jgi:hypothetical protein
VITFYMRPKFTYIYTPSHTYWIEHNGIKFNWESCLTRGEDRGYYSSNVPDTFVNMLYGLPKDLKR